MLTPKRERSKFGLHCVKAACLILRDPTKANKRCGVIRLYGVSRDHSTTNTERGKAEQV